MRVDSRRRRRAPWLWAVLCVSLAWALAACSDGDGDDPGLASTPGAGIGQGGAQDFGLFRDIVRAGGIPAPSTLDDVGFFNEHRIDQPPPDCGSAVCLHARLGVMANMVDGSNCTLLQLGLNTPLDPEELQRPPLDLVLALDTSSSLSGEALENVQRGLHTMLAALGPDDRVSLVIWGTTAQRVVDHAAPTDEALATAIDGLRPRGTSNLYDGLRLAYETALSAQRPGEHDRVVLVTDGVANEGIASPDRILRMSAAYAGLGVGITAIGLGRAADAELLRALSETGSGNYYHLDSAQAIEEVFTEEVQTALFPIAEQVRIRVEVAPGYRLGGIFGTRLATLEGRTGVIDIPSLFVAQRRGSGDVGKGRRGGGGAILVELLDNNGALVPDPLAVGTVELTWHEPGDPEASHHARIDIRSLLAPGAAPEEGYFEGSAVEKAFVMLNVFVGLRMATVLAAAGDDEAALRVLIGLEGAVAGWLAGRGAGDPDIAADLEVVRALGRNLVARGAKTPPEDYRTPVVTWPFD